MTHQSELQDEGLPCPTGQALVASDQARAGLGGSRFDPSRWLEPRPDHKGRFDELVARFADGMVHIETMSDESVYIGFYCDDGRAHQLWINSKKKLRYHEAKANGPAPRFTAWGVDRHAQAMSAGTVETLQAAQGDSPPARSEGCAQPISESSHD